MVGLAELREKARKAFESRGFPTTREEDWRYTDLAPLGKLRFETGGGKDRRGISAAKLDELCFGGFPCARLVFVDGVFALDLSEPEGLPRGAFAGSLNSAPAEAIGGKLGALASVQEHPFAALNTSKLGDGAFLFVPRGARIEKPVHLLFVATGSPTSAHPRILVVAEEGSEAAVVESYVAAANGAYFTNPVAEVFVGPNASVEHYRLQRESEKAFHVSVAAANVARDGRYHSVAVDLGGGLVRNDLRVALEEEGAECALDGFYMVGGRRHVDNHTTIEHRRPHGTSRELYKGILSGEARSVFHGRIVVRPDAQKTDAYQTNNNLILSGRAEANTKPQLEIFANDVKCKHGATIGRLDANALFYLRSRGIGPEEARRILAHAFADQVIDRIAIPEIRRGLDRLLLEVLG